MSKTVECISFKINGIEYKVNGEFGARFRLVDFIRKVAHLSGTKFMCRQGGCGACIVTVEACNPTTNARETFSVNSCLVSILRCHNWEITTVEGLGNRREGYHEIQKRLAHFNGTQCGYCTPGWVMQMHGLIESNSQGLTMKEIENSFGSNLCRCTGYRSIADAFKSFANDAENRLVNKVQDIEDLERGTKGCKLSCGKSKCCRKNATQEKPPFLRKDDVESDSDDDWVILNDDLKGTTLLANIPILVNLVNGNQWIKVFTISDIFAMMDVGLPYTLVAGNTGHALYEETDVSTVYIDISSVDELNYHLIDQNLVVGAGSTLTELLKLFKVVGSENENFAYIDTFAKHLDLVAHIPVRNIATIAGNLSLKHRHNEFPSDLFLMFETVGAYLTLQTSTGETTRVTMTEFLETKMKGKLILNVLLPPLSCEYCKIQTYKIMSRMQNSLASVNAGFLFHFLPHTYKVKTARVVYGNLYPSFNHATKTEAFLVGKNLFTNQTLQSALKVLKDEIKLVNPPYKQILALNLFYKAVIHFCPEDIISPKIKTVDRSIQRGLSSGLQCFDTNKSMLPLKAAIPKLDALVQCAGEAKYSNDLVVQGDEVFATFVLSSVARGSIQKFNAAKAMALDGYVAFYTHSDIPGVNNYTPIIDETILKNEEILSSGEILYHGQPIAIVVAKTESIARRAALLVEVEYKTNDSYKPVLTILDALKAPDAVKRIVNTETKEAESRGNSTSSVISGKYQINEQYHFTFETITTIAKPAENGFEIFASSQWLEIAQVSIAECLGISVNKVSVIVSRLGGGYGLKITRPGVVACAAAIVSAHLNVNCRFVMNLEDTMRAIGKRNPNYWTFDVGVNSIGTIQYLTIDFFGDVGCSPNEAQSDRILVHIVNCYDARTWKVDVSSVLTEKPSSTWCRGPGSLEAICSTEYIMERIAHKIGKNATAVRIANMVTEDNPIPELIKTLKTDAEFDKRQADIIKFNAENRWIKKAIKLIPMTYPLDYHGNFQIILSVFREDGSVAITQSGVEMGQGLTTKLIQTVAYYLSIPITLITIKPNNTSVSPNAFCTVSTVSSESVCYAAIKACNQLLEKLKPIRTQNPSYGWKDLVSAAHDAGISLLSAGYMNKDEVEPYNVYGVTILELELDLLTGKHNILRVDLLEDTGESLNPDIDIGQIEGAFVMGLGYWTSEEIIYNSEDCSILTFDTWNYKPPGIKDIPTDFRVYFRRNSHNSGGVLGSKGTGEPAICMSVVVAFALREAVQEARIASGRYNGEWFDIEFTDKMSIVCVEFADMPSTATPSSGDQFCPADTVSIVCVGPKAPRVFVYALVF